jgi:hypothetical protein
LIKVTTSGSFQHMTEFFNRVQSRSYLTQLEKYGPIGVQALQRATPIDTGLTSQSWYYEIVNRPGYFAIHWLNSDIEGGISVAAIIQYGHATRHGGYVEGLDYINPSIQPIFDQIVTDMWKEVTR